MRRAISTLLIFSLLHRLLHLPGQRFFQHERTSLFEDAFLLQKVLQ